MTYNRLQTMTGKIQEAADEAADAEPAADAVDIVDSDYSEARLKSEWAAMLGLNQDKGLRREIKKGTYRVKPNTSKYAQNIRLHIDDLPQDLKNRHQRNQRAADVKRTTDGQ